MIGNINMNGFIFKFDYLGAVWKLSATFTIMNLGEDASHNLGISFYQMERMTLFLITLTTSA